MNKLIISNTKIYNNSAAQVRLGDPAILKLNKKVQDLTQELFQKHRLSGKFEFRATRKGITIIKKSGTETLKDSKEIGREILQICEEYAAKQSRKGRESSDSESPGSSESSAENSPNPISKFSAFGIAPRPAPLTPQQSNPTAPLIPGAVNPAPNVDVQQLLAGHHALQQAHAALQQDNADKGRRIDELTRERDGGLARIATLTDERAAAERQVLAHAQTIRDLTGERDAALARIDTLTDEKAAAERQVLANTQTIRDLTGERDAALARIDTLTDEKAAAERQVLANTQTIRDLTGERDAALARIDTLTDEKAAAERQVLANTQTIRDLTGERDISRERVQQLSAQLSSLEERYRVLDVGAEKLAAEKEDLTRKAVYREEEIARLTSQRDSLDRRILAQDKGIKDKMSDFARERESLQSQLTAAKDSLAEIQHQQEDSARRIQELQREKGAIESQSQQAILSLTSQKVSAESRASEALHTIESLTNARDIAVAQAQRLEQANTTLQREQEAALSTAAQVQLTIGHLRREKEIAEAAAAELRPALTLAKKEVTTLTEQNQLALQQLAEKTQTVAAAQRTIELQEAELRAFREESTATSQRVGEQASRILQLEASLKQATEQNESLTAARLEMQSRLQRIEEERQFAILAPAEPESSATQLEHEKELERMRDANLELDEAYRREIGEKALLISQLQSALSSQTEQSEANADKRAELEQQIERQEGVIANLRKRLEAQRQEAAATIQKAILGLEYKLDQKQAHVELLQARQPMRERELEQSFQERTQNMRADIDRLEALKKQLATDNQRMRSQLAAQEIEIRKLKEWDADSSQYISKLGSASIQNRSLRQELEERTAQLTSAEEQILTLTAQVEKQAEWFNAGMAEITRLRLEQQENGTDQIPVLRETIAEQEKLLVETAKYGKKLLERNELLQEENAEVREELQTLLEVRSDLRGAMSRVGQELAKSAQLARAIGAKHNSTTTNSTESTDQ